jgi:circadian clock protein KaiB
MSTDHSPDPPLEQPSEERLHPSVTPTNDRYFLRLFVAGMTPKSIRAIANIKQICEVNLAGRYALEVIDLYQQPELARDAQIVAVPTLVKALPLPLRRIIGDLASSERVLVGLDLRREGN